MTFIKVFLSIVLSIISIWAIGYVAITAGIATLIAVPIALLALAICIGMFFYKILDKLF